MSTLKSSENLRPDLSQRPYPSWDVVATIIGARQGLDAGELQARKEARIWQELANEPRNDDLPTANPKRG